MSGGRYTPEKHPFLGSIGAVKCMSMSKKIMVIQDRKSHLRQLAKQKCHIDNSQPWGYEREASMKRRATRKKRIRKLKKLKQRSPNGKKTTKKLQSDGIDTLQLEDEEREKVDGLVKMLVGKKDLNLSMKLLKEMMKNVEEDILLGGYSGISEIVKKEDLELQVEED